MVGPGKPRRRSFLLQLLAGRSPIGVEVRGPFRRARDAVEADCGGAGACRGNLILAILRFVFHLSLSLSLSLSLKDNAARPAPVRAHLSICVARAIFARAREKKASGDLVEFWIQRTREKRTKIRTSARVRFDVGSSPLAENFNRVSSFAFTTSIRDGLLLYLLTFFGMRFFIVSTGCAVRTGAL